MLIKPFLINLNYHNEHALILIKRNKLNSNDGNKTVEELQSRMRANLETIQILTHQVNNLQRENQAQKEQLEKEITLRQTFQIQLESKNQIIQAITNSSSTVSMSQELPPSASNSIRRANSRSGSPSKSKINRSKVCTPSLSIKSN